MKMRKFIKFSSLLMIAVLMVMTMGVSVSAVEPDDGNEDYRLETGLKEYEIEEELPDSDTELYQSQRKGSSAEDYYWKNLGSDYYYNQLSEAEKQIWDDMEDSCLYVLNNTESYTTMPRISNSANVSRSRLLEIAWMFRYSNPQYYFLSNYLRYATNGSSICFEVYDVFQDGNARAAYTRQFRETIDYWIEEVSKGERPEEMEKIAHDIIADNVVYKANSYDQSAFSAVCLGQTVCTGYAGAMTILCNAVGIDCVTVTSSGHAWNNVSIHGNWYIVDVTWNDQSGYVIYVFYNKSEETVNELDSDGSHIPQSQWETGKPECLYDSGSGYFYDTPYFTLGDYVYFRVNDNSDRGMLLAKVVETLNNASKDGAPSSVNYNSSVYYITTEYTQRELVENFVDRLYRILLDRPAEPVGKSAWTNNLMNQDSTSAEIVSGIIYSDEFKNRGLSDADVVECLYRAMLDRESDQSGKSGWLRNLTNGMSYTSIINGFAGSTEFAQICSRYGISAGNVEITEARDRNSQVTAFVARCYREALLREADTAGLNGWCGVLLGGQETPQQVARGFVFSDEVLSQNLDDGEYVELLYRLCMGREAEEEGYAAWCRVLANGGSREEVFWGFANSAEFSEIISDFGL